MKTSLKLLLTVLLLLTLPAMVQAQFQFTTNNGAITITRYTGAGGDVVIPASTNGYPVTTIGINAFRTSHLTSVTIGTNVTAISDNAFQLNPTLAAVTIPESVTNIGFRAFFNCALPSVTISSNVTSIGAFAFGLNSVLSAINVDSQNTAYSSLDGVLFNKSQTALLELPGTKAGTYIVPSGVTNIGTLAFGSCTGLTNVTIPVSTTSIGDIAFSGASGLQSITVDPLNPVFSSLVGVLFSNAQTALIAYPENKIGSYTVPGSVTSIGRSAFQACPFLSTVIIGNSVTNIGNNAFSYCSTLVGIYVAGNAPKVDSTAFSGNTNVVYYLPGTLGWTNIFGGRPTAQWWLPNPLILSSPNLGVQTNGFGFVVSWATNLSVAVEARANLAISTWAPLYTNALTTNGWFYFSDPDWTNYPTRLYRIRSP